MEQTISNSEFAEKTEYDYQKVRRWAREIFGVSKTAGQSSGKARKYSFEQAFLLYLAGNLISQRRIGIQDTKVIIDTLNPWLKQKGFFPLVGWKDRVTLPAKVEERMLQLAAWEISVLFYNSGEICLTGKGIISGHKERVGKLQGHNIYKLYQVREVVSSDCDGEIVNEVTFSVGALIGEFSYFFGLQAVL